MKLEINDEHKLANISNIKTRMKKISTLVLGTALSISLLTGCYSRINNNGFYIDNNNITISSSDIKLSVNINNYEDINKLSETLKNNNNIEVLEIHSTFSNYELFNEDNFGFLREYNIKVLDLSNVTINPTFLESLGSIEFLRINSYDLFKYNIDYTKLKNLKKIHIKSEELYDYPVFFTNKIINKLKENNVEIVLDNAKLEDVISLNNGLDGIVNGLGLNENSSDIDKLNAILLYILDNFEYDEEVAKLNSLNQEHKGLTSSFYTNGILDGIYNKNGNIICGNYSGLFQALANRVGLTSYYVNGSGHAWNMVCFGNERYYVDSTWLDTGAISVKGGSFYINRYESSQDFIRSGNGMSLEWYLDSVYNIDEENHQAVYIPSNNYEYVEYINDEEVNEEFDLNSFLYEIIINNERFITNASTVLGILLSLGIANKVVKKINREEKTKRKTR